MENVPIQAALDCDTSTAFYFGVVSFALVLQSFGSILLVIGHKISNKEKGHALVDAGHTAFIVSLTIIPVVIALH